MLELYVATRRGMKERSVEIGDAGEYISSLCFFEARPCLMSHAVFRVWDRLRQRTSF